MERCRAEDEALQSPLGETWNTCSLSLLPVIGQIAMSNPVLSSFILYRPGTGFACHVNSLVGSLEDFVFVLEPAETDLFGVDCLSGDFVSMDFFSWASLRFLLKTSQSVNIFNTPRPDSRAAARNSSNMMTNNQTSCGFEYVNKYICIDV